MSVRQHLSATTVTSSVVHTRDYRIRVPGGSVQGRRWQTEAGEGRIPILLFHDSLGSISTWQDFPAKLAAECQRPVYAYDRLGFGASSEHPGPWTAAFITQEIADYLPYVLTGLEIDQPFVAYGYSVGGAMAACSAAHEHCQALILQSTPARVDLGMVQGLQAAQQWFADPARVERLVRHHGDKAAWVLAAWLDTWLSPAFSDWQIMQVAPQIHCPLLVLHGRQDEYAGLAHVVRIAALATRYCQIQVLDNCGHAPHREHPAQILRLVRQFLQEPGVLPARCGYE